MSLLSPIETIKILLPGLIALTSLLIVIITFLLEKYIPLRSLTKGRSYRNLIWCMTTVLMLSGIGATVSLLFLLDLKLKIIISDFLLILCIICILILVAGIVVIVIKETFYEE